MSTIVEFTIATEEFSLGRALRGYAFDRVELDRAVPTADTIVPLLWVYGADPDALHTHLGTDEHVANVQVLAELGELLGVSDAAASERLRRGQTTLVTATLLAGAASPPTDHEA